MKKLKRCKRGVFFSSDAMIALTILLLSVMIIFPVIKYSNKEVKIEEDVLKVLSTLKVGEIDNPYIQSLISNGNITELNKTLIEQIGEFYITDKTIAKNMTKTIFDLIDSNENIGLWFEDELIYSRNSSPIVNASFIEVERQFLSGIKNGSSVKGFSARAYLSNNMQSKYSYFGGYIGEGNISIDMDYSGNISLCEIELAINKDFDIYINGNFTGRYNKSIDDMTPIKYQIPIANFSSGENQIELIGDNLYIAGGYVKILYESDISYEQPTRYYFPGITGAINLYDSIYIPGNISYMNISLHFMNNFSTFLTIGDKTIYNGTTNGTDMTINISNSFLSSILNYSNISKKTIPLRFGLENVSYVTNITNYVDVFSVTDLSGSMAGTKITNAKNANHQLIEAILNESIYPEIRNRVGLVGYRSTASNDDYHDLSKDNESLHSEVESWSDGGATCICCGINKATRSFDNSNKDRKLVAYYNFDNDVNDSSSNKLDGIIYGSPSYVTGVNGSALEFHGDSGNNDYVMVPNNESIGMNGMSELTFSMWIMARDDSQYWALGGTTNNWDGDGYNMYLRDSWGSYEYAFTIDDNNGGSYVRRGIIEKDKWHHVAGTYDGSIMRLYLDGIELSTSSGKTGNINPNDENLTIGRIIGYSTDYFFGKIDEVRIYNYALNATEVLSLNNTNPTCGNNFTEVSEVCDGNFIYCNISGEIGVSSCNSTCSGYDSCQYIGTCGDGIKNSTEQCDDGNTEDYDGCSSECNLEDRYKSMIVMSDGEANRQCNEQGTGNAKNDAIQAACEAYTNYGIIVHAVGFGTDADETTLQAIAVCGNGSYYYSDLGDLTDIYQEIAENIIKATFSKQTIETTEDIYSILYPDSYIEFNYTKEDLYGLIITIEKSFDDNSSGTFDLPTDSEIFKTDVISYSGDKWTDNLWINDILIYNLSLYGDNYIKLGDPYVINIPNNYINSSSNIINLSTGLRPGNSSQGSGSNKIIYTILKNIVSYSSISSYVNGCIWELEFDDSTSNNLSIPSDYSGSDMCYYKTASYDTMDALQTAVYNLLKLLDFDLDGDIDVKFTEQNLNINSTEMIGIPYGWSTEIQIRRWR